MQTNFLKSILKKQKKTATSKRAGSIPYHAALSFMRDIQI